MFIDVGASMTDQRDTVSFPGDGVLCFCRQRHTTVIRITRPDGRERWELPCRTDIRMTRGETAATVAAAITAALAVSETVGSAL